MISIVMVSAGADLWEKLTVPAIVSLKKHCEGSDYELIVVDNGGAGRGQVCIPTMLGYAEAMNLGVQSAAGDRLLLLNNDIVVRAPFLHLLGWNLLEGPTVRTVEGNIRYLEGWCLSIDRGLWELLGGFDARLRNSWEDVDLSWRAGQAGVALGLVNLPIVHLYGQTRSSIAGANQWDFANRAIFLRKKSYLDGLKERIPCCSSPT